MKTLWVGDVHAKVEDLDDCEKLLQFIERTAREHHVDRIVFLGDQYHQHAIVNVEVQRFWLRWFATLPLACHDKMHPVEVIALKGNHDAPGDKSAVAHAMQVHKSQVTVIEEPTQIGHIVFMPYFHDPLAFIAACRKFPTAACVVCHQTFNGAQYENGFYAKEAVDPAAVPQGRIISGHIHTPSSFDKVWYPGSPRWQTISDANIERCIYVEDTDPGARSFAFSTGLYLRRIWQLTDVEGQGGPSVEELLASDTKDGDRVVVNLQGTRAWCEARKRELAAKRPNTRFRTFPTDLHSAKVRESDGVAAAFQKHFEAYRPKNGTSKDVLSKMVQERIHVQ